MFKLITSRLLSLTEPYPQQATVSFWLGLSLAFAMLYSGLGLNQAFTGPFVVQDDAQQHVFWMQRFLDPTLFPDDLIADYFQSVAPIGYATFYKLFAWLGIHPLIVNKLLPLLLDLGITCLAFYLALAILPVPLVGFINTLLLNQNLWMADDLASGTPRAFFYPCLLGFLLALTKRSLWGCVLSILLQGWFYPPTVFLSAGVLFLRLLLRKRGRVHRVSGSKEDLMCLLGLGAVVVVLLPYALQISTYGPVVSLNEAKSMPEFFVGRRTFFSDNWWVYWINGRSGLFPKTILSPATLAAALLFPGMFYFAKRLPLMRYLTRHWAILPQLMVSSLGMFLIAHATLFRLHLPSRYTQHSFRILLGLAAAIVLVTILDVILRWSRSHTFFWQKAFMAGLVWSVLSIGLLGYPAFMDSFLEAEYHVSHQPQLYKFLAQQPKDSLIASLSDQASYIPTFTGRSILVSRQHSIPYHTGYYRQIRQRVKDLLRAQYSPEISILQNVIRQYQIDFWLLEKNLFDPSFLAKNTWFEQFQPETQQVIAQLQSGEPPALMRLQQRCTIFDQGGYRLVSAPCLLQAPSEQASRSTTGE